MFNTEAELVQSIIDRFNDKGIGIKKYNKENIEIKQELNLGYGIPDIVIAKKKAAFSSFRDKALNMFDVSILDIIKKEKKINIKDLLDVTKSNKNKLNHSLSVLVNEKIISNYGEEYFHFENYEELITESIAIEVKLKNWKRALNQAHRYKWFADESYVLLPESNIQPASNNLDIFKKFNVGLLSFDKEGEIKVYLKPKKSPPISREMQYLLNEQFI